jgi:hypothetical protein
VRAVPVRVRLPKPEGNIPSQRVIRKGPDVAVSAEEEVIQSSAVRRLILTLKLLYSFIIITKVPADHVMVLDIKATRAIRKL